MKNVLIKADYSGQELRILAEISQDREMINAFNNGLDLHLLTANRVFNLGLDTEALTSGTEAHNQASKQFKRERHQAKNGINFPTVYGAFPKRIAEDNNVSIYEASRWLEEFNKLYPSVQKAIETTKKDLWNKGYVWTLMGRKRRFPGYRGAGRYDRAKMERQAFNFKIQGFAADMLKIAMNKIRPKLSKYKAILILTVHDEIVVECPKKTSKECAAMMKETMENCVKLSVPIEVDVDIVNTYGD
jgi:DNA polymerase-1